MEIQTTPRKVTHIEGRRWFQRTYGNTYHAVRISFSDGSSVVTPIAYGYDDQWIETALEWLEDTRIIPRRERSANGSRAGGTRFLREVLAVTYSVADMPRERDLKPRNW